VGEGEGVGGRCDGRGAVGGARTGLTGFGRGLEVVDGTLVPIERDPAGGTDREVPREEPPTWAQVFTARVVTRSGLRRSWTLAWAVTSDMVRPLIVMIGVEVTVTWALV
jgi:hypothetical protein